MEGCKAAWGYTANGWSRGAVSASWEKRYPASAVLVIHRKSPSELKWVSGWIDPPVRCHPRTGPACPGKRTHTSVSSGFQSGGGNPLAPRNGTSCMGGLGGSLSLQGVAVEETDPPCSLLPAAETEARGRAFSASSLCFTKAAEMSASASSVTFGRFSIASHATNAD